MSISGNIAIAGVYEHPSRFSPDKTEFQIMAECTKGALDEPVSPWTTSTGCSPPP